MSDITILDPYDQLSSESTSEEDRFTLEHEFIELLSSPKYIQYLYLSGYFKDISFINYIKYLQYWRLPKYIIYITHINSIFFLEALNDEEFRNNFNNNYIIDDIHNNIYYSWKWGRLNRALEYIDKNSNIKK